MDNALYKNLPLLICVLPTHFSLVKNTLFLVIAMFNFNYRDTQTRIVTRHTKKLICLDYISFYSTQEGGHKSVFLRLLKLNAAEWPYLVIGCITSFVAGSIPPMFALIYGAMMKARRLVLLGLCNI